MRGATCDRERGREIVCEREGGGEKAFFREEKIHADAFTLSIKQWWISETRLLLIFKLSCGCKSTRQVQ